MAYSFLSMLNLIISAVVSIFGTPANLLVLYVYHKSRRLHTLSNILVIALTLIDLLRAGLLLPTKVYNTIAEVDSMAGITCPISGILSATNYLMSAVILSSIAVLRYFKIVRPMAYARLFSRKRVKLYCVLMTLVMMMVSLLPVIGIGEYEYSIYHGLCFTSWDIKNLAFRTTFYTTTVGVSMPIMLWSYYKIFSKIKQHNKSIRPNLRSSNSAGTSNGVSEDEITNTDCSSVPSQTLPNGVTMTPGKPAPSKEVNVTKVMFSMVIVYVGCWTPAMVMTAIKLAGHPLRPQDLTYYIATILEIKCLINPLIYSVGNRQFRKAFKARLHHLRNN